MNLIYVDGCLGVICWSVLGYDCDVIRDQWPLTSARGGLGGGGGGG